MKISYNLIINGYVTEVLIDEYYNHFPKDSYFREEIHHYQDSHEIKFVLSYPTFELTPKLS